MRNQGYKGLILCGAALLVPVWFAWLLPRITVLLLLGVLTLFFAFMVRAFLLCRRQKSVLGFLVSLAVILMLVVQCLTYILSNFGFLLFAPLSMPLFSYGGRGLLTNMFLIGFLLSVFRTGNLAKNGAMPATSKISRFIQYENGRIIINLKTHSIE